MNCLIGVDIGTTSTKAIAFDINGKIITQKSVEYTTFHPKPTWSEQDPHEIFKAVLTTVKETIQEINNKNLKVEGISFSCAMHSLIAVNKDGEPLTNCIIWADSRSDYYAKKLKEINSAQIIYARTGTPIHPMSPLCKLLWLKENEPEIFNNAYKFISIKEYVFYKLFSEYIVDYSIASATGLFDIFDLKWNNYALNTVGITSEKLSSPVPTTFIIRGLKDEFAQYLGISKDTPFIVGASDGCLSNLGSCAINPKDAAITIGTSGAIRVISDKPVLDEAGRTFSYILTEKHYVVGGPINNGGIVLQWFKENFYPLEAENAQKNNNDFYDILVKKAEKIAPGANGLIFLPYLLGERAPYWNPNARGVFFGINITHKREHFLRALMEGVIFSLYSIEKVLEKVMGDIEKIYVSGGFVKSSLWLKILSDVFNKKVFVPESYESSCLGAVILGMQALKMINKIEEVKEMIPIVKIIYPDINNHYTYSKLYPIFEQLYYQLKNEFRRIVDFQQF